MTLSHEAQAHSTDGAAPRRPREEVTQTLLRRHAPKKPAAPFSLAEVANRAEASLPFNMLVVSADIRNSTIVMKEASGFRLFARTLNGYLSATRQFFQRHNGWWDKFTEDGFLCYWFYEDSPSVDQVRELTNTVLHVCRDALDLFADRAMADLRANSSNFPSGVGLSFGIDAGRGHVVNFAGDATIVGLPVVGAVRMVSAAKTWEVVTNVHLGEHIERHLDCCFEDQLRSIRRDYRETKEYPEHQEVYSLQFRDMGHIPESSEVGDR